jgi:hypothetical protein
VILWIVGYGGPITSRDHLDGSHQLECCGVPGQDIAAVHLLREIEVSGPLKVYVPVALDGYHKANESLVVRLEHSFLQPNFLIQVAQWSSFAITHSFPVTIPCFGHTTLNPNKAYNLDQSSSQVETPYAMLKIPPLITLPRRLTCTANRPANP